MNNENEPCEICAGLERVRKLAAQRRADYHAFKSGQRADSSISNTEGRSKPQITGYGHYEDTLEKRDGKWLFTSRKILNENVEKRAAGPQNPTRP